MENTKKETGLKEFFEAIYKGIDPKKNYIDVRSFKVVKVKKKAKEEETKWEYKKVDYFFERIRDIDRLIKALEGEHFKYLNVHFGVAPRYRQSGTEADVKFLTCFWCDLDCKRKNKPDLPTKEEALKIIESFKLAPSIIVDSGNGYHLYWFLSKPIEIKNSAYKLKMRGVLAGLSKALGGDIGIDLSRCLRLPGTLHIKDGYPGLLVKIIKFDPNLIYDIAEFKAFYVKQEETILGTVDLSKERIKDWIQNPDSLELPENFYKLLDKDEKLKETFSGNRPDMNDTTKSGYSMSLASLLTHRKIFTDEQIIKAMILHPRARERKKTPQNLLSTLKKAKGSASKKKKEDLRVIIAGGFRPTDLWNSENFFKKYEGQLLYCKTWNSWLVYQEGKWQEDNKNKTQELGKKVIMDYYRQASEMLDDKERKKMVDQAQKSESQRAIRAMTELATSSMAVVPDDFDQNPFIFNLKNGTLNLKTMEFREHEPTDRLMKITDINYTPGAKCLKWETFLDKIFEGNKDLIDYMQTALGYSLTGDVGEQCWFVLYGIGANGKTTFINVVLEVLGDYGINTPFETFLSKGQFGNIPNDLARMKGARFVSASEAGASRRFNEALLKDMVGSNVITARFLRQEYFDFKPECKIWLASNHKPLVREFSLGFWRKIRLIPFKVVIPEEERILNYDKNLLEEKEGIFNWILEGYEKWQEEKLKTPEEVIQATEEYKSSMDIIAEWIEECCIEGPRVQATTKELYEVYKNWCGGNNEDPIKSKVFGRRLEERGYKSIRIGSGGKRGWGGIALKDTENLDSSIKEDPDNMPMAQESIDLFGEKQETKTTK